MISYKGQMYYQPEINVPTFTVDNKNPFSLGFNEGNSESYEFEIKKSSVQEEPKVNQMKLNSDYQNYIYLANTLIYRNQFHQLNKNPIFDKKYYLENVQ